MKYKSCKKTITFLIEKSISYMEMAAEERKEFKRDTIQSLHYEQLAQEYMEMANELTDHMNKFLEIN